MGEDIKIVPTILTDNPQVFNTQIANFQQFARRLQIDLMDGTFTSTRSIPDSQIPQLPENVAFDLHYMTVKPSDHLTHVLRLKPSLCIFHAEAGENLLPFFAELKKVGIKSGVAILPATYPEIVQKYIEEADHVLVFAGTLGKQGGTADLLQIEKIKLIRKINPTVEIGWDGGVNITNIRALAHVGLNIVNVGSAISQAQNPAESYKDLLEESKKRGVYL